MIGKLFVYWRVESTQLLSARVSGLDLAALTWAQLEKWALESRGACGLFLLQDGPKCTEVYRKTCRHIQLWMHEQFMCIMWYLVKFNHAVSGCMRWCNSKLMPFGLYFSSLERVAEYKFSMFTAKRPLTYRLQLCGDFQKLILHLESHLLALKQRIRVSVKWGRLFGCFVWECFMLVNKRGIERGKN